MKLLLSRGRAVRHHFTVDSDNFTVDSDNAAVVTRLCHRLDGLPLAIELAAEQLRHRSESELLDELELSLAALPAAFRDLPDRQRTLTATIAWSYQLLGQSERKLFEQLGVFAADPTVATVGSINRSTPAAEAEAEDLLTALERQSLLRRYTDPAGARRVSMLHSIRQFSRHRLRLVDDAETVRRRHAEFYLGLAEAVSPRLWGMDQVDAFRLLHADSPDLRGALLWVTGPDGSTDLALRLVGHLWHYWELTGDVAERCEVGLRLVASTPDVPPALKAPALSGTATLCWILGRNDEASDLHDRALQAFRRAGNERGVAWTTMCLATQAAERDDSVTAQRLAAEALSLPHASPRTRVAALIILVCWRSTLATSPKPLPSAANASNVPDRSAIDRSSGIPWLTWPDSTEQSSDYDTAEQLLYEALGAALELGAQGHVVAFLESTAGVYAAQHRVEQAIRVLAAADAYRTDRGLPLVPAEQRRIESIITRARTEAGPIRFGLAWAGRKALTLTQVVREVLHSGQGATRKNLSPIGTFLYAPTNFQKMP